MKVLVIADEAEAPAFSQVTELRNAIQELVGKVDLLAFSKDSIFFNQKQISEKGDTNIGSAQNILAKKRYTLIIVSLETDNLKKLFFEKSNIMQYLRNSPSRVRMYVFGASNIPDEIVTSRRVDLFSYSLQARAARGKINTEIQERHPGLYQERTRPRPRTLMWQEILSSR